MSIKVVSLSNVSVTTDAAGKTVVTGVREEASMLQSVITAASLPIKINNDEAFVSESTAAIGAIGYGVALFHAADYLHVRKGARAISPITKLFAPSK